MKAGDIILIWCYRGYRPGTVKAMGKRSTLIAFADGTEEWIGNKRVRVPLNLKDEAWMRRSLKEEIEMHKNG